MYMPDVIYTTKTFEDLLLAISNKGYNINKAIAGSSILAPEENYTSSNLNNYSVVLKLDCHDQSFLFTGDSERKTENQMDHAKYAIHQSKYKGILRIIKG